MVKKYYDVLVSMFGFFINIDEVKEEVDVYKMYNVVMMKLISGMMILRR